MPQLKSIKDKKVRHFYEEQNDALSDWLEVDSVVRSIADDIFESFDPDPDHDGLLEHGGALQAQHEDVEAFLPKEEREKRSKAERSAKRAIIVNVVANIFLLAAKVVACFFSSSLSLIASTVDSALDLLCTIIVWTTNRLVQWRLTYLQRRFPVGRRRLEPLGILVFSIFMILSFAQIFQEAVEKLMPQGDHETVVLGSLAMGAMGATILVKGIIWFGCIKIKTTQVQALAQDCRRYAVLSVPSRHPFTQLLTPKRRPDRRILQHALARVSIDWTPVWDLVAGSCGSRHFVARHYLGMGWHGL